MNKSACLVLLCGGGVASWWWYGADRVLARPAAETELQPSSLSQQSTVGFAAASGLLLQLLSVEANTGHVAGAQLTCIQLDPHTHHWLSPFHGGVAT